MAKNNLEQIYKTNPVKHLTSLPHLMNKVFCMSFRFITIFALNTFILAGCTETKNGDSASNISSHFCDLKYVDIDMKEYSHKHLSSRLAFVLFESEYKDSDCSILKQGSKISQNIYELFHFITDENYSLYSCKKAHELNIYALPDYVSGEYDLRSSESYDLCLFKAHPLGRKSYNIIYNIDHRYDDYFQFQKLIHYGG